MREYTNFLENYRFFTNFLDIQNKPFLAQKQLGIVLYGSQVTFILFLILCKHFQILSMMPYDVQKLRKSSKTKLRSKFKQEEIYQLFSKLSIFYGFFARKKQDFPCTKSTKNFLVWFQYYFHFIPVLAQILLDTCNDAIRCLEAQENLISNTKIVKNLTVQV